MGQPKRSFSDWLNDTVMDIVKGAFWLFETMPLTGIIVLPVGLLMYKHEPLLFWVCLVMLVDAFFGRRRAEEEKKQEEERMMNDFYRWHFEEMEKCRKGKQCL